MPDPAVLPLFLATCLIALLLPGPDVAFIVATGVARGRSAAIAGAGGIALGILVHALLAAAGISAVFATSPLAFEVLRAAGAAYLLWCAWQAWRSPIAAPADAEARPDAGQSFRRGLLTNLLNPKAILFIGVFLPQFADPGHGAMFGQIFVLGGILAAMALAWFILLGCASSGLGRWLLRSRTAGLVLPRLLGGVFVALAVRLLVTQRPA